MMNIMLQKKLRKALLTGWLIVFSAVCAISVSAAGKTYSVSFPVSVRNPGSDIPEGTKFSLVIEGQPHAPLPQPSEIIADVNGIYEFSAVEFTEPGIYRYTVRQFGPDDERIIADDKEYKIVVTVIRDDEDDLTGGFTISDNKESVKAQSIVFSNSFSSPSGESSAESEETKETDETKKTDSTKGTDQTKATEPAKDTESEDDGTVSDTKEDQPRLPGTGEPLSAAFVFLAFSGVLILCTLLVWKLRSGDEGQEGAE